MQWSNRKAILNKPYLLYSVISSFNILVPALVFVSR